MDPHGGSSTSVDTFLENYPMPGFNGLIHWIQSMNPVQWIQVLNPMCRVDPLDLDPLDAMDHFLKRLSTEV